VVLTISPRLFDQGSQWFTLTYLAHAFTGATAIAITNSLWVSGASAGLGVVVGFPIAWLANRTTLPRRRFVLPSMWLVVLLPSWLPALGWERIVQPDGVMYRLGMHWLWVTHLIMGPFGVVLLLGLRAVPFTYLAVTAGLAGLAQEFEDAARVHGAGRAATLRLIWPMLAPAIWSALAIGFAEAISDFGVASTLAYSSNFTLGTYQLYADIGNFPPSRGLLPIVSRPLTMAWLLTFCGVFLELPISQLLYAPNEPPASVAINDNLSTYATSFGVGMAQSVLAVGIALILVGAVLGGYRLFAPAGWRRIGATIRG
jgi:ABC-type Fe3+ transport system permease subunit